MLATSLITMWMTQGLRLMQISTWLGPLVRMVLEMATDVLKWLCLLIVFLLAFAASFYSIFVGGVNTDLAAALEGFNRRELVVEELVVIEGPVSLKWYPLGAQSGGSRWWWR